MASRHSHARSRLNLKIHLGLRLATHLTAVVLGRGRRWWYVLLLLLMVAVAAR